MASEKADMPQDTDSLPPNYASSETYSDSPPPAYRKTSTVRLQITRVICLTILLAGFLTGTFILAHTWITTRNACDCSTAHPNLPLNSAALVQAKVLPAFQSDAAPLQEIENAINEAAYDQESRQVDIPLPLDEEADGEILEEEQTDKLQDIEEEEEEAKDVRLPVDMLLGNPNLAGKDVKCKVQKKVQNLGAGIMSKTIMVTCDDETEEGKTEVMPTPFGGMLASRPLPRPPMSLLAPILKMMAARANARFQKQMKPKIVLRKLPQPIGPFSQLSNGPFPNSKPGPFAPQLIGVGVQGPSQQQGMFPEPFPFPGSNVIQPNVAPSTLFPPNHEVESQFDDAPEELNEPPRNMLFRDDLPKQREMQPIFRPFPAPFPERSEIGEPRNESPIKIVHGFPPQIPEAIKDIVSKIMGNEENENISDNVPVIAIKSIPEQRMFEAPHASQKPKLLLPFPFRAVKIQGREGRKLNDEEDTPSPFPLPRGAIPAGLKPIVMPEAAGRALDSPVTLPSLQEIQPLRFFPGRILRLPMPIHGRTITHMEMKKNPFPFEGEPTEEEEGGSRLPEDLVEEPFGPPRLHTVITRVPPVDDNISQDSSPIPPFVSRFPPPPPPPSFAREGRSGIIKEIESDAELVNPLEVREHHIISVN